MALRNSTKGSIDLLHTKNKTKSFSISCKKCGEIRIFLHFAVNFTLKVEYIFVFLHFT